jgi:hypothetical protein
MKKTFTLMIAMGLAMLMQAQTIVSTLPQNKKAVLEEMTGTGCPNCPAGHTEATNLLTNNPGKLIVIAYHPSNSNYTSGDPMASTYAAAFYTSPFISASNRFMPSAIINRRAWNGGDRIQDRTAWAGCVSTILTEASPLNVGVSSEYNTTSKILTINSEVYFTDNVNDNLTIYCMLIEDGIIATQSGGTSPYTHNHVFRKATVAQWGDPVSAPTTSATLKSFSFTLDNSTTNYDMTKCEVVVMIRNAANEEIISGNIAKVNETSPISVPSIADAHISMDIYPNPVNQSSNIHLTIGTPQEVVVKITNMAGQLISIKNYGNLAAGSYDFPLTGLEDRPAGMYFVTIEGGNSPVVQKVVVN